MNAAPAEAVRARLSAYLAHDYSDHAGRAAYYAEDAVCYDPVGAPPAIGRTAIGEKFRQTVEMGVASRVTVTRWIIADGKAALDFDADVFREGAKVRSVSGVIIFDLSADLMIRRMEGYIAN